jgi:origin recognition complex subunit 3
MNIDDTILQRLTPHSSWLDRIPFAFLFGVATSVELFEARLLKSTCQTLYGDQFDVEQTGSIVDKIFKAAVAHSEVPILIGPNLVGGLLERQHEQVASIQDFIRSLKVRWPSTLLYNSKTNYVVRIHVPFLRESTELLGAGWVERGSTSAKNY